MTDPLNQKVDHLVNPVEPPEPPASRGDSLIARINHAFPDAGIDEIPDVGEAATDEDAYAE